MSSLLFKIKSDLLHITSSNKIKLRKLEDPILREVASEVPLELIATNEFRAFTNTMVTIMQNNRGQGIAAPQVGVNLKVIAVQFTEQDLKMAEKCYGNLGVKKRQMKFYPLRIFINPKMQVVNFDTTEFEEGCLSLDNTKGIVKRYKEIELTALNEQGEFVRTNVSGWMARIIQHEIHHLKGLLIVDYFVRKKHLWSK